MTVKKAFAIFLLLAMMLCVSAAVAEEIEYTLEDLYYEKGISTITWTASKEDNDAKYLVAVLSNNDVNQKYIAIELEGNEVQTDQLIPGQVYTIFLADENGNSLVDAEYTIYDVPPFEDGLLKDTSIKVKLETREFPMSTNKAKKVNALSAQKIIEGLKDQSVYYGVKYHMQMPRLAKPRTFFVTLVFESPDGFMTVERATDITFDRVSDGYQEIWWEIAGPEFFYDLYQANEKIPTGTYKIHLYWDGMKVNTSEFEVGE